MENKLYLYPYSAKEADRNGEIKLWRESFKENIRCRDAIEAAIRENFDGMRLNGDCASSLIQRFGYKRVAFVLANTLQQLSYDGRFSRDNKDWGKTISVPPDQEHNSQFCVRSHPAVLDGFINEYRKSVEQLGLYGAKHCVSDAAQQDYEGKVLILSPEALAESYWEGKYQLWYAHDGFGCRPGAIGRSIRASCLYDGEQSRWQRTDFIGPIAEEHLPDWAKEQVQRIENGQSTGFGEMDLM